MTEPIEVRKASSFILVSDEVYAAAQEFAQTMDAFMAMSPEERAAAGAKAAAERDARRAAAAAEAERFLGWLRDAIASAGGPFAEAHLAIVDDHPTHDGRDADTFEETLVCATCAVGEDVEGDPYPCRTLRALAKAYGWSP